MVITKVPYPNKVPAGEIVFTESQDWVVPRGVKKVDVFLVGGGGGPGNRYYSKTSGWPVYTYSFDGGGGGGGYTATYKNVSVTPGVPISVIVGNGGAIGENGGASSFGTLAVNGGFAGANANSGGNGHGGNGGSGGAGGGGSARGEDQSGEEHIWISALGGSPGIDGGNGTGAYNTVEGNQGYISNGGIGQGSTTRAFGEPTGTLYANGGGRSSGGNDGSYNGSGGSGIVIVRWAEQ